MPITAKLSGTFFIWTLCSETNVASLCLHSSWYTYITAIYQRFSVNQYESPFQYFHY